LTKTERKRQEKKLDIREKSAESELEKTGTTLRQHGMSLVE